MSNDMHCSPPTQVGEARQFILSCCCKTATQCVSLSQINLLKQANLLFLSLEFESSRGVNNQWMGVRVTSQGPGRNVMVWNRKKKQSQEMCPLINIPFPCRCVLRDTVSGTRTIMSHTC